jgi:hypothetical protein
MKQVLVLFSLELLFSGLSGAATIPVVVSPSAPVVEQMAAADLSQMLGRIYPGDQFPLIQAAPVTGACIILGDASDEALKSQAGNALQGPESFAVLHPGDRGLIVGADPRGASYGVYRLLEKLGCGFYESFDVVPPPRTEPFSFASWSLADAPTVSHRFVFDWHNFISSCSTWNLDDWKKWILQSHKMGFNGIMVHAYGNNPMVCFSHNGQTKPVGWLASTAKGSDWGTQHVEDVRKMFGGDAFSGPVFGSEAALVGDDQRVQATKDLMRKVFAYAKDLEMEVILAIDVDTPAANPQNILNTLPSSARYGIPSDSAKDPDAFQLANPDTPEGLAYFSSLFGTVVTDYPQIDQLVLWIRKDGTPGLKIKPEYLSPDSHSEYQAAVAVAPPLKDDERSASTFVLSRIARAARSILDGGGHSAMKLGLGSWGYGYWPDANRFMPPEISFFNLDSHVAYASSGFGERNQALTTHRQVFPIFWIQDDDRAYIGNPYAPVPHLSSVLHDGNAAGFGIVHWLTHPFDMYFRNMADQTWQQTSDQSLEATLDRFGDVLIGGDQGKTFAAYLNLWATTAPRFGRETSNIFIDTPLDAALEEQNAAPRRALLDQISDRGLSPQAKSQLDYYRSFESFMTKFFQNQAALQQSIDLRKQGDTKGAIAALNGCDPGATIELYRSGLRGIGLTRGEQGLLVSLNLRWLPPFIDQRQALGLESIRVAFAPTQHDDLAQGAGKNSFRFDDSKNLWVVLGTEETKATAYTIPEGAVVHPGKSTSTDSLDLCRSGIRSSGGYAYSSVRLPAGPYRVRLIAMDPDSTAAGQRVFNVMVSGTSPPSLPLDIFSETGAPCTVIEKAFDVTLRSPGAIRIRLNPVKGDAILSGLIIEPTAKPL